MTPRKPRQRQNHAGPSHLQQVQASDYDSETLLDISRPPPRTNSDLNLTVLRRYNPSIAEILSIAGSSWVYSFDHESGWDRSGVEGTLFVCQLQSPPVTASEQFGIVVLNRKGLNNLIVDMRDVVKMEVTDSFVILHVSTKGEADGNEEFKPIGLFLPDESTRETNHSLIKACWEKTVETQSEMQAMEDKLENYGDMAFESPSEGAQNTHNGQGRRVSITDLFGGR
ncbi:Dcp1-like decapping protein [Rutstroemia sp. NJR-2017a WRK4]|nr:Dcp1-like decapping protein [Rutstroemia sp. NJR-2017a WRK4]